jgi:magnesium transporter
MGAVGPIEENYLEAGFATVWRKRAFWLACLFLTGLLTFQALVYFEHAMSKVRVLALFIPLCISTGGNSGSQAATLITRALALGQVSLGDWLRVLRHELLMGLALGLTLGVLGFGRAWLTPRELLENPGHPPTSVPELTLVIAVSVTAICLWGTLVGSMLPLLFQRFGIDPGIASSPFVATLADVTGIFIYFSVANALLL